MKKEILKKKLILCLFLKSKLLQCNKKFKSRMRQLGPIELCLKVYTHCKNQYFAIFAVKKLTT